MIDTLVIGGGIIGLATARVLQTRAPGARVLVLEKEPELAAHQTGHNSGVIHAGVYYPPGSLKARLCKAGNAATRALCERHGLAYAVPGKLIVATDTHERAGLRRLHTRIGENGLERRWLEAGELADIEPNVRGVAAVHVPASGIVDYRAVSAALAGEFEAAGGEIRRGCAVTDLAEYASEIVAETGDGTLHARRVVACAGLMADRVVRMLDIQPDFRIVAFRGEYYRLASHRSGVVRHLIYPVPDPATPFLGVHLTPLIDGTMTVGPNAVLAFAREGYAKTDVSLRDCLAMAGFVGTRRMLRRYWRAGLREFAHSVSKRAYRAAVNRYCPTLTVDELLPHPAGVRAQAIARDGTPIGDFHFVATPRSLHVANAPSPAATAALPIAHHIAARLESRS